MSWLFDKLLSAFESVGVPLGVGVPGKTETDSTYNLSTLKVVELKALAKERGLSGYTGLRKADLVEMLQQN